MSKILSFSLLGLNSNVRIIAHLDLINDDTLLAQLEHMAISDITLPKYNNNYRHSNNVISEDAIFIDIDDQDKDMFIKLSNYKGINFIALPSKSFFKTGSYHLIIPLYREIVNTDKESFESLHYSIYCKIANKIQKDLGITVDMACKDTARLIYGNLYVDREVKILNDSSINNYIVYNITNDGKQIIDSILDSEDVVINTVNNCSTTLDTSSIDRYVSDIIGSERVDIVLNKDLIMDRLKYCASIGMFDSYVDWLTICFAMAETTVKSENMHTESKLVFTTEDFKSISWQDSKTQSEADKIFNLSLKRSYQRDINVGLTTIFKYIYATTPYAVSKGIDILSDIASHRLTLINGYPSELYYFFSNVLSDYIVCTHSGNYRVVGKLSEMLHMTELKSNFLTVMSSSFVIRYYDKITNKIKMLQNKQFSSYLCVSLSNARKEVYIPYNLNDSQEDTGRDCNTFEPFLKGDKVSYESQEYKAFESIVLNNLCSGDQSKFDELMIFLASILFNVKKKIVRSYIFAGEPGSGKTMFGYVLQHLFRESNTLMVRTLDNYAKYTGPLRNKLLLIIDEHAVTDRHTELGNLVKSLVTSYDFTYEYKFKSPVIDKSYHRVIQFTNKVNLGLSVDDRRFIVYHCTREIADIQAFSLVFNNITTVAKGLSYLLETKYSNIDFENNINIVRSSRDIAQRILVNCSSTISRIHKDDTGHVAPLAIELASLYSYVKLGDLFIDNVDNSFTKRTSNEIYDDFVSFVSTLSSKCDAPNISHRLQSGGVKNYLMSYICGANTSINNMLSTQVSSNIRYKSVSKKYDYEMFVKKYCTTAAQHFNTTPEALYEALKTIFDSDLDSTILNDKFVIFSEYNRCVESNTNIE